MKKKKEEYAKAVGRPRAFKTKEELEDRILSYWARCEKYNKPYTLSGLALWIGIDRKTLYNYSQKDEFFLTIKKAKDIVEASMEERALNNESNTTFSIFALKNNFDWTDKREIEQNTTLNGSIEIQGYSTEELLKMLEKSE